MFDFLGWQNIYVATFAQGIALCYIASYMITNLNSSGHTSKMSVCAAYFCLTTVSSQNKEMI